MTARPIALHSSVLKIRHISVNSTCHSDYFLGHREIAWNVITYDTTYEHFSYIDSRVGNEKQMNDNIVQILEVTPGLSILILSLPSYVILGGLLNLIDLIFKMEIKTVLSHWVIVKIK